MIKLTFEARDAKDLYKDIAHFLEQSITADEQPKEPRGPTAGEIARQTEAHLPKPPTAKVRAFLTEFKVPEEEWDKIPRSGKNGNMLKVDAERYISQRNDKRQSLQPVPDPAATQETAQETTQEEVPEATLDDAKAALKKLAEAKGIPSCMEVLSRYGVNRISLVPTEKLAEFIAHAESVTAGGEA